MITLYKCMREACYECSSCVACDDVVPVIKIIPGCRALLGADSGYLGPMLVCQALSQALSPGLIISDDGQ